jgi:hypothetical protein
VLCIFILTVLINAISYFTDEDDNTFKVGLWNIPEVATLVVWAILLRWKKNWQPVIPYLYALIYLIMLNLVFRDALNEEVFHSDPVWHVDTIYFLLTFLVLANYSTFLTTIIATPLIILIPFYFMLEVQSKNYVDWVTCKALTDSERQEFVSKNLNWVGQLVLVNVIHHYYVQKDLAISVIDKCIVERQ